MLFLAFCQSREEVERSFFKKAISMCQDVHFQVRIAMCQQLLAIGRTVGGELLAKQILEELLELLKDEEGKVREMRGCGGGGWGGRRKRWLDEWRVGKPLGWEAVRASLESRCTRARRGRQAASPTGPLSCITQNPPQPVHKVYGATCTALLPILSARL